LLRSLQEAAHLQWKFSWSKEDDQILINLLMNDLESFLNNLSSPQKEKPL
jgi:hypothetical protein